MTDFDDETGDLVPEDHAEVYARRLLPAQNPAVRSAYGVRAHFQDEFALARVGSGDVAQFQLARTGEDRPLHLLLPSSMADAPAPTTPKGRGRRSGCGKSGFEFAMSSPYAI